MITTQLPGLSRVDVRGLPGQTLGKRRPRGVVRDLCILLCLLLSDTELRSGLLIQLPGLAGSTQQVISQGERRLPWSPVKPHDVLCLGHAPSVSVTFLG